MPKKDKESEGEGKPQMAIQESNGEVSASIEETNRIRAELGLKPLRVEAAADKGMTAGQQLQKERESEEIAAKIEKARKQRLLNQKTKGKSLGEELAEEDEGVLSWVKKSRELGKQQATEDGKRKKKKPGKQSKESMLADRFAEEDEAAQAYTAKDLKGLTLAHTSEDFKDGQTTILTLADSNIIDDEEGEYKLNDDNEMLENVNLSEDWRRKSAKEKAQTKYNAFGEYSTILEKYDDDIARPSVTLDNSGGVDEERQQRLAQIRDNLKAQSDPSKQSYDLTNTSSLLGSIGGAGLGSGNSDYMTQDEMAQFKKAGNAGKKKKLRKKVKENLDFLNEFTVEASGKDHGSRNSNKETASKQAETAAAATRAERYNRAVQNAQHVTDVILNDKQEEGEAMDVDVKVKTEPGTEVKMEPGVGMQSVKQEGVKQEPGQSEPIELDTNPDEAVDAELYAALARARRLKDMKKADTVAATLADESERAKEIAKQIKVDAGLKVVEEEEEEDPAAMMADGLEFSATTEFCRGLQTNTDNTDLPSVQFRQQQEALYQARIAGDASVIRPPSGMPALSRKVKASGGVEGDISDSDEEPDADFLMEKGTAAGGLADVLELARYKNMLAEEALTGRTNDERGSGQHMHEPTSIPQVYKFKLDYYDEYGRQMTPKEAFRHLSHKFHGRKPGKAKQEKRMKEYEMEMRAKNALMNDTPMQTINALQKQQVKTKSAHLVLTGPNAIKPEVPAPKEPKAKEGKRKGKVDHDHGGKKARQAIAD